MPELRLIMLYVVIILNIYYTNYNHNKLLYYFITEESMEAYRLTLNGSIFEDTYISRILPYYIDIKAKKIECYFILDLSQVTRININVLVQLISLG